MPFCENCGNKVSETSNFCPSCGLNIKGTSPLNQKVGSDINHREKSDNGNIEYPPNNKLEDLTTENQEKDIEVVNVDEKVKSKKHWYSRWWFWSMIFCFFSLVTYDEKDINASAAYGIVVVFILIYNAFIKTNSWIGGLIGNAIRNFQESKTGKIVIWIIIIVSGLLFFTMRAIIMSKK
jgi:hypothetical protein